MTKIISKLLSEADFHIPEIERLGIENKFEKFADLLIKECCKEIRNQELPIPIHSYWLNKVAENIEKSFEVVK